MDLLGRTTDVEPFSPARIRGQPGRCRTSTRRAAPRGLVTGRASARSVSTDLPARTIGGSIDPAGRRFEVAARIGPAPIAGTGTVRSAGTVRGAGTVCAQRAISAAAGGAPIRSIGTRTSGPASVGGLGRPRCGITLASAAGFGSIVELPEPWVPGPRAPFVTWLRLDPTSFGVAAFPPQVGLGPFGPLSASVGLGPFPASVDVGPLPAPVSFGALAALPAPASVV
ncbi:hypothetical protein GII33_07665 [Gordonia pseudamarae]|uniref:Uncharacterized protein n=1 Tax=Gordonia pseudamarae TaxID=2831662 RepID=A0ABX6IGM3_9ACTN|nr:MULTISPECIES: hypothetical protein [Gordonia]MBD0023329.1 hypothetical protein [Gordonia sp. (in: high G+C Gram-positive bacteria)]QHN25857.1 hypothetical protein GII33_07665 [Gordonia pseudamarae]QHN34787.1 hypothetical protein GII31_07635 [Gordonia pseudamarae]